MQDRRDHRLRTVATLSRIWLIRDIRARYRQSILDIGWSVVTPAVTLAAYGFVLTKAFGVTGDGVPYLSFAWSGLILWTFMAGGLTTASISLVNSADLVRKVYFPREVIPLTSLAVQGVDLAIGFAALAVLMVLQGIGLSITVVAVVPVLVLMVVWTAALAILFASITAFLRDLAHGLSLLLRIGIFVTPVMYPLTRVPERYRWMISANPFAVFIDSFRDALLYHQWPRWDLLAVHGSIAIILACVALWYVRRVEGSMADVI